jgi:hypothetical protein
MPWLSITFKYYVFHIHGMKCYACDKEIEPENAVCIRHFYETLLGEVEEQTILCRDCYNEYKARR